MLQLFSFISSNKDDEEVGKMKRNMLLILKLGTPKNGEQYCESAAPKILVEDELPSSVGIPRW